MSDIDVDEIHLCPLCRLAVRTNETISIVHNGPFAMLAHEMCEKARPTKQEWEGGLPEVGVECEVRSPAGGWHGCFIVGHHKSCAVFFCDSWTPDSDYDSLPATEFRPLKSKQERQREELAALCDDHIKRDDYGHNLAAAILSRYNLEPKP